MKIYLDNCCFNRPFDDQNQIRIRLESEAKLYIQEKIRDGELKLAWSYIMDIEVHKNPFEDRRNSIFDWKKYAVTDAAENEIILRIAESFSKTGIHNLDALHLSCAIYSDCDFFITTDDGIIRHYSYHERMQVINPTEFIKVMEETE